MNTPLKIANHLSTLMALLILSMVAFIARNLDLADQPFEAMRGAHILTLIFWGILALGLVVALLACARWKENEPELVVRTLTGTLVLMTTAVVMFVGLHL